MYSKAASEGEGSVMRGNNIINKIEGIYVRIFCSHFLYFRHVMSAFLTLDRRNWC